MQDPSPLPPLRPLVPAPRIGASRPRSAAIVNLGCKVNQSEMEAAARLLREAGVPLVDPREAADLYVVNTCTVTSTADEKSRSAVRRVRRANPGAQVVVTGCSVAVDPGAFALVDAGASLVGNDDKAAFLAELGALLRIGGGVPGAGEDGGDEGAQAPLDAALPTLSGVEASERSRRWTARGRRGSTASTTTAPRSSAPARSSRSRTAARSTARTASSRGPAATSGPSPRTSFWRTCGAPWLPGTGRSCSPGSTSGRYDGGWSERGARGSHVRSALTLAGLVRRLLDETGVERIRLSLHRAPAR